MHQIQSSISDSLIGDWAQKQALRLMEGEKKAFLVPTFVYAEDYFMQYAYFLMHLLLQFKSSFLYQNVSISKICFRNFSFRFNDLSHLQF